MGNISPLSKSINGTTNCDQLLIAISNTADIIPGIVTGISIILKICSRLQPSIIAASSSSLGMVSRNPFRNQVANGADIAIYTAINPILLLSILILLKYL